MNTKCIILYNNDDHFESFIIGKEVNNTWNVTFGHIDQVSNINLNVEPVNDTYDVTFGYIEQVSNINPNVEPVERDIRFFSNIEQCISFISKTHNYFYNNLTVIFVYKNLLSILDVNTSLQIITEDLFE